MIFNFEIKSLGVVINILQKPTEVDFDNSGTINGVEALVLGIALSLDAFGARDWSGNDWYFTIHSCRSHWVDEFCFYLEWTSEW